MSFCGYINISLYYTLFFTFLIKYKHYEQFRNE